MTENISPRTELIKSIQKSLNGLQYDNKSINFFMGRVKNIVYPFISIYLTSFDYDIYSQGRWKDVNANCVIEFAYAQDTDDEKLDAFGRLIEDRIAESLKYERRGELKNIKVYEFSANIVDGFYQLAFSVNYQIDTEEKMRQDSIVKMQEININF